MNFFKDPIIAHKSRLKEIEEKFDYTAHTSCESCMEAILKDFADVPFDGPSTAMLFTVLAKMIDKKLESSHIHPLMREGVSKYK